MLVSCRVSVCASCARRASQVDIGPPRRESPPVTLIKLISRTGERTDGRTHKFRQSAGIFNFGMAGAHTAIPWLRFGEDRFYSEDRDAEFYFCCTAILQF